VEINFSNEEYKTLLEVLYLADWILNSYETDKEPKNIVYHDLEQKILSLADKFEHKELVDFDEKYEEYIPSNILEEGPVFDYIDDYNEETFWEELIDRLSKRDLLKHHTESEIEGMEESLILSEIEKYARKYAEEFEANGLKNIEILNSLDI
jgi:hypothetical protein